MSNPEPRSAFAPHWHTGHMGAAGPAPVTIADVRRALATAQARKGRRGDLVRRIEVALALALPDPGVAARGAGDVMAYPIAPDTWLLAAPLPDDAFAQRLAEVAGDAGSVVDQSHGKVGLRVSGERVRDCLDKICRLDLHPRAFPPLRAGVTQIAHTAVLICRCDDGSPGAVPAFDLVMPSTFAIHVLEAVEMAAAEFGLVRS